MIGIVTQPLGYNYGGILQNYALQRTLENIGFNSITLDVGYRYANVRFFFSKIETQILNCFGINRPYPPKPFKNKSIPSKTGIFIFNKIKTTKPYNRYSSSILKKYKINVVIVGSDQVWRPIYNESIENMFLDFVGNEYVKIAYAASFGTDEWEYGKDDTDRCRALIKSFAGVSVRERSGIKLVKERLKYESVEFVLDPTMLLNKEHYLSLCNIVPQKENKYICLYILDVTDKTKEIAKRLSEQMRMPIRQIYAHGSMKLTVEEWLSCIRDASFVITDSFHGMVFSIIFNREFIVIPNDNRGNSRFLSLLEILGLNSRVYDPLTKEMPIDWTLVNKRLEHYKIVSLSFLKKHLQNVEN